jgi:hypothetical protein
MKRDAQTVPSLFMRNWRAIYQRGEKTYVGKVFEWSRNFLLCKLLRQCYLKPDYNPDKDFLPPDLATAAAEQLKARP